MMSTKTNNKADVVDVQKVSWKRNNRFILDNITWQIQTGEHWALVGLNGSGKTSLLNLIHGSLWPTTGQVSVLGHRYGEVDLRELRKQIGWVSSFLQQRLHKRETAEKIVLSGKFASIGLYENPAETDREQAISHMIELGCEHLVGRSYETLSQGERQKILIARALMASPSLLILDEPCTGLDLIAREQVLQMINHMAQMPNGPTLIYVTHHIEEILPSFTHTFLLRNGKKFMEGKRTDVLTPDHLSDFFQTPLSVQEQRGRKWITLQ